MEGGDKKLCEGATLTKSI